MAPPARSGVNKDRPASKHGVKLPALSPPQSPKRSAFASVGRFGSSPSCCRLTHSTPAQSNDGSSSPVKPLPPALPAGPTATSAARAAASPSSPPKSDARKRPLAKLGSSPVKPIAVTIAPLEKQPQTPPAVEAPASPRDTNVKASETAKLPKPTTAEARPSQTQEPPATQEPSDAAATEAVVNEEADIRGDGTVQLIYQQYDELFPIAGGSTTQAAIDDVYCLSFVMPNCRLHLAQYEDAERFARLERGETHESVFVREQPLGTFLGLEADRTYFVVVEQEAEQLERDQQAARELWAPERAKEKLERDDGRGFESCSCIYGNPCVDEYGCRDWHLRFAVATANGWKGF